MSRSQSPNSANRYLELTNRGPNSTKRDRATSARFKVMLNTMSLLTYSSMHWWPKAHLLSMLPRLHHGGSLTMVVLTMLPPTWATSRCIYHILNLMILSSEMAPSLTLIQPLSKPPLYLKMVSVSLACKRMISISQSYTSNNFSVYFLPSTFLVKKFLMRTGHHFIVPNSAIHNKNTPNLVNFIQKCPVWCRSCVFQRLTL